MEIDTGKVVTALATTVVVGLVLHFTTGTRALAVGAKEQASAALAQSELKNAMQDKDIKHTHAEVEEIKDELGDMAVKLNELTTAINRAITIMEMGSDEKGTG